jgi:hypothetical protein
MRTILFILAAWHGANGVVMLVAPEAWYAFVPDVTETGPANLHFIRDIGLAFIAAAAGLVAATRAERPAAALLAPAIFLGGHAGLHLVECFAHGVTAATALRDTALILVPGFLPLAFLGQLRLEGRAA